MEWFSISRNCFCVCFIHTNFQHLLVRAFRKEWNQPKMPMPNMSNNHLSRNWEEICRVPCSCKKMGWSDLVSSYDMFMMLHPYMEKTYFCLTCCLFLVSGSSMDQTPIEYLWWNDRKPTIVTHSSLPDACENDSWRCDDVHRDLLGSHHDR